ncbi:MAG: uroporphyrinogen-III C-methyltransferase [Betaproteobacteria bacterium]|nr:uroporphyrinogen-III C-methyltransferase [Betaproteobacteria bacterium]
MEKDALTSSDKPDRLKAVWPVLQRLALPVAMLALGLLAWQWFDARSRMVDLQQEVARRLTSGDSVAGEARAAAKQTQEGLAALQAKVGALEAKLAESQSQQMALDAMVQELTLNREARLLSEIEQALNTAAQQLQLAGNVEAALIALQEAEGRLAAAGRARFLPLRKLISRDIERLKALPLADVPGISLRIEGIVGAVDTLPLAFEAKPRIEPAKASFVPVAAPNNWEKLLRELWAELRGLIRVERMDRPNPELLSPTHAFFLRENLKLRLVNARLLLLQRDGKTFRQEVKQAQAWIEQYFDLRAKPVQAALSTLRQLAAADVGLVLPTLEESLTTLRNYKVAGGKDTPLPASRPRAGSDGSPSARGATSGPVPGRAGGSGAD